VAVSEELPLVLLQGGVMATHDEETRKFFKHSSVICVVSPRYASNKLSIFKQHASFLGWISSLHALDTLYLIMNLRMVIAG
jgi:hypothetical protein